jgi:HEAT repeat protein
VLTVIAVRLTLSNRAEPKYRGHRLLEWVDQLGTPGADELEAEAAIRAIGTNAIPFLFGSARQGAWQQKKQAVWDNLPARVREMLPPPDWDYYVRRNKLPVALSLLGAVALSQLITAVQDQNEAVQLVAIRAIGMMGARGEPAVPVLIGLLSQTNAPLRNTAAWAIGQFGPIKTQAIPALIAALPLTVRNLGAIGPEAQAAVPALTVLLDSPKEHIRLQAATALWQIAHSTNLVDRISQELEKRQSYVNFPPKQSQG